MKSKVEYYRSGKFGEFFRIHLERIWTREDILGHLLESPLPLKKDTMNSIISGYCKGNLLGATSYLTRRKKMDVGAYAVRLSHFLNILEVQEDSEMIQLARETMDICFDYPPKEEFITGGRCLRSKQSKSILNKVLSLSKEELRIIRR